MVLLFALVITSAIGGSIKVTENFWEDVQNPEIDHLTKPPMVAPTTDNVDKTNSVPSMNVPVTPSTQIQTAPTTDQKKDVQSNIMHNNADMTGETTIEPFEGNMFAGI
jgi:hypothetical protein